MISDFVNVNLGKIQLTPDPPHGIDGQCVNLASSWSMSIGGPELMGATAWQIFQNFRDPFFDVVTPGGHVDPGDIMFFLPDNAAVGTGAAGHVDIVVDQVSSTGFRGLDTDWKASPKAQLVSHSYNGVAGWFRPKGANMDTDKFLQDGDTVNYYRAFEGRDPSSDELAYWRGKTFKKIYYDNALGQATSLRLAAQNPQGVNHDSVLTYIQNNLK